MLFSARFLNHHSPLIHLLCDKSHISVVHSVLWRSGLDICRPEKNHVTFLVCVAGALRDGNRRIQPNQTEQQEVRRRRPRMNMEGALTRSQRKCRRLQLPRYNPGVRSLSAKPPSVTALHRLTQIQVFLPTPDPSEFVPVKLDRPCTDSDTFLPLTNFRVRLSFVPD